MTARYANVMDNIISVCDRESDIFEYIAYKDKYQQRFIVRAKHERIVATDGDKLTPYINQQSSALSYQVKIQQKAVEKHVLPMLQSALHPSLFHHLKNMENVMI